MAEPDALIKQSIKALLEGMQLRVDEIPEASTKTPDFLIDQRKPNGSLLEVKTKQDDPNELAAISAELDLGGVVARSKPTDQWNRLDNIISSGVKQLQEYDPKHSAPHFIWFHCDGRDADLYSLRLKATLYGSRKLISTQIKDMVTCYYFWNSSFFRHRTALDGVVISQEGEAQLNLNEFSLKFAVAQNSSLARAFGEAVFYPKKYQADADVMINDSDGERKDENKILAYLQTKYRIDHLQTIDMAQHTGMIRMPEPKA